MDNLLPKSLEVPFIDKLDELSMEAVSDLMEQDAEKHSIECRNWVDSYPYHPITVFTIAHSHNYIYVDYFVRGNYLRAENYKNNTPVSEDSCVEFFLKTPGSKEYWNFEFNCIGTVNASHRQTRENPIRLNDEQLSQIKRYASCGTKPFQEMEGLFAWNLVIAIPFSLIGVDTKTSATTLKGNFYKCGSKTGLPHYLSWSPILTATIDFHRPEFFGDIILK
ncbi:MAG: carbohydrate-binding family 9-like protein [Muribaculaceae bacterium]